MYTRFFFSLSLIWMEGCRGHGNGLIFISNQDMKLEVEVVSRTVYAGVCCREVWSESGEAGIKH